MLRAVIILGLAGLMSLPGVAQSDSSTSENKTTSQQATAPPLKKFYHLRFVVQETENEHVINSRSYSLIMREYSSIMREIDGTGSVRAGEKVPFSTTSGASPQWQQIDVGVNIDCRELEVTPSGISMRIKAEISSVMDTHEANGPPGSLPIIRNNQWESVVVLPVKQPTVLFSSDDPASKRTMQLQLTVEPMR